MHEQAHVLGGGMTDGPKPFEALTDYVSGAMSDQDAAGFEEELFAAAAAGGAEDARFVDRVHLITQYLEPRGGLDIGSTRQRVDQLLAAGLKVQVLEPEPADVMTIPPIELDAEIVVTHYRVDLRGYDSIDVVATKPDGTEIKTFRDVNLAEDGSIYAVCEAPLARVWSQAGRLVSTIIGTRNGQKEVISRFESFTAP
jgi:hypothetical protein